MLFAIPAGGLPRAPLIGRAGFKSLFPPGSRRDTACCVLQSTACRALRGTLPQRPMGPLLSPPGEGKTRHAAIDRGVREIPSPGCRACWTAPSKSWGFTWTGICISAEPRRRIAAIAPADRRLASASFSLLRSLLRSSGGQRLGAAFLARRSAPPGGPDRDDYARMKALFMLPSRASLAVQKAVCFAQAWIGFCSRYSRPLFCP
jgi:hypothetical protein